MSQISTPTLNDDFDYELGDVEPPVHCSDCDVLVVFENRGDYDHEMCKDCEDAEMRAYALQLREDQSDRNRS